MKKNANERLPLSVIVPVYNVEPYLRRCLDSILQQTRPVQEIICVDDGSTDGSLAILREYERAHAELHVIHKENGGLVSARKAGLARATCPYAAYVDSDDFIEPEMYEELMRQMIETDADVVTSGDIRDYGTHAVHAPESLEPGLYAGERWKAVQTSIVSTRVFFQMNHPTVHIWDKVYRTELLHSYQDDLDERISVGEDAAVVWPLLLQASRVCVSGKEYYHYCLRNDSIMGAKPKNDAVQLDVMFDVLQRRLQKKQADVPNIMEQFVMLKNFFLLLRDAGSVLKTSGEEPYPFGSVPKTARIALYGAGKFGNELQAWLAEHGYHVVLWVDKAKNRAGVEPPAALHEAAYDIVLLATLRPDIVASVEEDLQALGVPKEKVRKIEAAAVQSQLS